jgi:septal ring factor EnvC (AmiA/AmiB activator)
MRATVVPALRPLLLLGCALLALPAGLSWAAQATPTRQQARGQLQALRARIARMDAQNSRDARAREQLTGQLRAAELSLSHEREVLASTQRDLAEQTQRRAELSAQHAQQAQDLATARTQLADEIRAAYLLGRQGALQLLLNQRSPLQSARLLTYYGYYSRAGAARLQRINADLAQLDALDAQLAQQQQSLTGLQSLEQAQLRLLDGARAQRERVLVSLNTRVQSREGQLQALQEQRTSLERLLEQLRQQAAARPAPIIPRGAAQPLDLASAFGRLHGQLPWPVQGRVQASFGQQRASGVAWDGVLIDTTRGSPVRSVAAGRVVYADWLPGLGLLLIVDHGAGYLSLYGHNDRLYRSVGASVAAGELIAAAGDTGGRPDPQLYFEIRQDGRPIDPLPWFRARTPSP